MVAEPLISLTHLEVPGHLEGVEFRYPIATECAASRRQIIGNHAWKLVWLDAAFAEHCFPSADCANILMLTTDAIASRPYLMQG
jgi:hypothetical protein